MDDLADGLDDLCRILVLKNVSTDGHTRSSCFNRSPDHFQNILVAAHSLSTGDNHGDETSLDDLTECFRRTGVNNIDNIGSQFRSYP